MSLRGMLCAALILVAVIANYEANWDSLDRRSVAPWFSDAKFGIFIHWGVYSVPSYVPIVNGKLSYAEWYWYYMQQGKQANAGPLEAGTWSYHQKTYGAETPYENFAPQFKAELFDPKEWADLFHKSGAKYVVLTSKHHDGFTLWPSKEASSAWGRPWNAVEIGPHRDLLGDLTDAVRARGLKAGVYYSLYEWFNGLYNSDIPRYVAEHMFPQFKDLVTRYKPSIIFSDGEWEMKSDRWRTPELLAWLFNESPVKDEVVVNDRWGGDSRHKHGGYWTTEYTPGLAAGHHAWEESRGMGASYGYNRAERVGHYHTSRQLVIMLVDIVSRGGNLLLDIGPDADGTIPGIMEERLLEIGAWLRVNGDAIYDTRPLNESRQWSTGEQPRVDFSQNFQSAYDVTQLVSAQPRGRASIIAFFTRKESDTFAILPRWPKLNITLRQPSRGLLSVQLLGSSAVLIYKAKDNAITVKMPRIPEELMALPAWTLKLSYSSSVEGWALLNKRLRCSGSSRRIPALNGGAASSKGGGQWTLR